MKRFSILLLAASLAISCTAQARPKIGLVLSGGGAKGAAHVGVLKVLEQHHIPIDYIAGTSIGAFVGGMYALGYSVDEIEKIMLYTDWSKGYSDTIARNKLSYKAKQERDKYNIPINIGYSDGEVKLPSGLLRGQTMADLLRYSTNLVKNYVTFDDLAIPYRAVATNLVTSKEVVLDSGSIIVAMQASATVPGALMPAKVNNQLLVDGGIANNMPVDVVKAMGADIVIAVDIGSSLMDKSQLDSTVAVLTQLSTMLTNESTEKQKKLLTDKDILIRPDVGDLSTTDFDIMPKVLPLGIQAAEKKLSKLNQLSVSASEYQHYLTAKNKRRQAWQHELNHPIYRIDINNNSKISNELIRETFGLKKGDIATKDNVNTAVNNVYSLDKFERVNTAFTDTPKGRILTLTTKAKSWGPNYFNLGLTWEDDLKLNSAIALDLAYTMTNLTDNGGEWRNQVQFGSKKKFATNFYLPLDAKQQFYGRTSFDYKIVPLDLYVHNSRLLTFEQTGSQVELGIGYNYSQQGRIEMGGIYESGDVENQAFMFSNLNYSSYGGYFRFGYDSLDSISFPTHGNRFTFNVYYRNEDFVLPKALYPDNAINNDDIHSVTNALQIEADWKGALSIGNHAFVGKISMATIDKDGLYSVNVSDLGGFLNLSGYTKNSLMGPHKFLGAIIYQYDLGRDVLGLQKYPLYLGTSLEAGNVWHLKENINFHDLIYASSVYIGTDTDLGPAALGVGISDKGEQALYLFIGKNF